MMFDSGLFQIKDFRVYNVDQRNSSRIFSIRSTPLLQRSHWMLRRKWRNSWKINWDVRLAFWQLVSYGKDFPNDLSFRALGHSDMLEMFMKKEKLELPSWSEVCITTRALHARTTANESFLLETNLLFGKRREMLAQRARWIHKGQIAYRIAD